MKMDFLRYVLIAAASFAAALSFCSCGKDNGTYDGIREDTPLKMAVRLALTKRDNDGTKAGYDDGKQVDYENYIDFNDLRVMLFDSDNLFLTSFRPVDLIPVDGTGLNSQFYDLIGNVDGPLPADFKIVIMANCHRYFDSPVAGKTSIDDICTAETSQYSYSIPFILSHENTIPMYGVKECNGVTFIPDMLTYVGTVCMLRAMAKIELKCISRDWTIESARLYRYNRLGFCAPRNVFSESDYVHGDYSLDYNDSIHIVGDAAEESSTVFPIQDDGTFTIYVPEYSNTYYDGNMSKEASYIEVRFNEKENAPYYIYFKYYSDPPAGKDLNDAFDIRRNYFYRFTIDKKTETIDEPSISIDVREYDEVDLGPIFGLD